MTFGQAIKAKREALGLTQQDLAEKLFVSRQTVCRWENGTRCPDLIMSKKISMVLGISMDEMIPTEELAAYVPPRETFPDISCVKVMLTGILLVLTQVFGIAKRESAGARSLTEAVTIAMSTAEACSASPELTEVSRDLQSPVLEEGAGGEQVLSGVWLWQPEREYTVRITRRPHESLREDFIEVFTAGGAEPVYTLTVRNRFPGEEGS